MISRTGFIFILGCFSCGHLKNPKLSMSGPEIRNAVVLVIDQLGANLLGAYGSTLFETPNFNRLAAESLLFDQAISASPSLPHAYDQFWGSSDEKNWLGTIGEAGYSPVMLSDASELLTHPSSKYFDRILPFEKLNNEQPAHGMEQTELAHFFAQAAQAVSSLENGSCLWLHSRGLSGAWDAPIELRNRLANSEDPVPPHWCQPPSGWFDPDNDDPDQLLSYQQVCAAQVTLIDDFLGVVLDLMETGLGESTLLCLLSTRGYPLGEHGIVGSDSAHDFEKCHGESLHVPLMVRTPDRDGFGSFRSLRSGSLVQPALVTHLLQDWFSGDEPMQQSLQDFAFRLPEKTKEVTWTQSGKVNTLQTHAWKLITDGDRTSLYVKPDDRWEINDVSRRCPGIVEAMENALTDLTATGAVCWPEGYELSSELADRQE